MKKEILKTLPFSQITSQDDPAPLPARTAIAHLQMAYDSLPAKVKNHKEILIEFNNRDQEARFYYLRELEPGEQRDPEPTPDTQSPTQSTAANQLDDAPTDAAIPRPRPYMKNYDPEYRRPDFDIS
jgi:hypothetical protein